MLSGDVAVDDDRPPTRSRFAHRRMPTARSIPRQEGERGIVSTAISHGVVLTGACLLALGMSACSDHVVAPRGDPVGSVPMLNAGPPSVPLGSYTIPTPGTNAPNGGSAAWQSTSIPITAATWTLLTFRGSIAVSKNYQCDVDFDSICPSPLAGRTAAPKGIDQGYLSDSARVRYTSGGIGGVALSHDDTTSWAVINLWYDGVLEVKRHGIAGSNSCVSQPVEGGPPTNCPRTGLSFSSWETGWYLLGGNHSVTAEKIVPLYLDPSSVDVGPATAITFAAKRHPKLPVGITHWYFRYDDVGETGALDSPATPLSGGTFVSSCYQQSTCTFTPARSGRMYVLGTWQSKAIRASAIVFVNSGRLVLNANPTTVWAGDSVTFTPSATDGSGVTVMRWEWKPDTVPGRTAACTEPEPECRRPVYESGTMYVVAQVGQVAARVVGGAPLEGLSLSSAAGGTTFERAVVHVNANPDEILLTASPATIKPGQPVRFEAKSKSGRKLTVQNWSWQTTVEPAIGPALTAVGGQCSGKTACTIKVYETGIMSVIGVVDGEGIQRTASADVTTQACPVPDLGDPRLNDPQVRKGLNDKLDEPLPEGAKYDLEKMGRMLINPTTGVRILQEFNYENTGQTPDVTRSTCHIDPTKGSFPPLPPGFVEDTAIFHTHEYRPKIPHKGCIKPDDPSTTAFDPKTPEMWVIPERGPSFGDRVFAGSHLFPSGGHGMGSWGFLIDGEGTIWKFNDRFHPTSINAVRRYRRDGNSICYAQF